MTFIGRHIIYKSQQPTEKCKSLRGQFCSDIGHHIFVAKARQHTT